MSQFRPHLPPQPLLFGYDPARDLPANHLARLIEQVVEASVLPKPHPSSEGGPAFDPRLCIKVLLYGYATGTRSSRRLEQACRESLPFLFLTRGDTPGYRTLCTARKQLAAELERVWTELFTVAASHGLQRVGRLVLDSSRWQADAGREATLAQAEFAEVIAEFRRLLAEAEAADAAETLEPRSETLLETAISPEQIRDILRRMRRPERTGSEQADHGVGGTPAGGSPLGAATAESTAPAPTADAGTPDPPRAPDTDQAAAPEALPAPVQQAGLAGGEPGPEVAATSPRAGSPQRGRLTVQMRRRLEQLIGVIVEAMQQGRKHLNLTDVDAEFMPLGSNKKLGLGHSFEAVVDGGLLVVGQRGDGNTDNARLEPLLAAARAREPEPIQAVLADSGYYRGDVIGELLTAGVDVCIPDSNTAGDLHRGRPVGTTRGRTGPDAFLTWDATSSTFRCLGDNELRPTQARMAGGQVCTVYRAVAPCTPCPYAAECLQRKGAQHRTVRMGRYHAELETARQRFNEPEVQAQYRQRGPAIETVFAFLEHVLGYRRWSLRGKKGTAAEAQWLGLAFQLRKIQTKRVEAY